MTDVYDIARELERIAGELRRDRPVVDWVSAYVEGDAITSDAAGAIGDCSAATVRRRAAELAAAGRPIGVNIGGVWLLSKARWLADIERRDGAHAKLAAISRAEKFARLSACAQKSAPDERMASG